MRNLVTWPRKAVVRMNRFRHHDICIRGKSEIKYTATSQRGGVLINYFIRGLSMAQIRSLLEKQIRGTKRMHDERGKP